MDDSIDERYNYDNDRHGLLDNAEYGSTYHDNNNNNNNNVLDVENHNINNNRNNLLHPMESDIWTVSTTTSQSTDHPWKSGRGAPWTLRRIALEWSLYFNIFITITKLVAYIRTMSLSVLAALLDSVLDVVSQFVLNYTEKHSSLQRSSAVYPAGASRLEPIGVLTCAALMGMASFEVIKESVETLLEYTSPKLPGYIYYLSEMTAAQEHFSFASMVAIVVVKVALLVICQKAQAQQHNSIDPTLEALAQDHLNDALSNGVAAVALWCFLQSSSLWFLDPVGAMLISLYIIYSWYHTGKEQIEQLTGKSAPTELIDELKTIASTFDERIIMVDACRAYHFGPKFLVELEIVLPRDTLLVESHDLGMDLQYEIEGRDEIERCFVHIDYESRPYDEHVVSKVPEWRDQWLLRHRHSSTKTLNSANSGINNNNNDSKDGSLGGNHKSYQQDD